VAAADAAINALRPVERPEGWPSITPDGKTDPTRTMKAVTWQGKKQVPWGAGGAWVQVGRWG
jgi:hypothetical protein